MLLKRALENTQKLLRLLIGSGFLFALGLNFANVVMRYVFSSPIFWAEEVMIFIFVWCVFMSAALVTLAGDHLAVELLDWMLPPAIRRVLKVVIHIVSAAVMVFVAWRASSLVELVIRLDQRSIIGEFPMGLGYGAVLLGSVLIVIASLLRAAELVFGTDIGRVERKRG